MVSSPSTTSPRSHCHHIVYYIIMKSLSTYFKTTQGIHTIHDITTKSLSSHRPPHEVIKSLSTYFKTTRGIHTIHDITMRCHHTIHHHHEVTVDLFLQNDHCGSFVYTFKTQHTGAPRQSKPHLPSIRQIPTTIQQQRTQPLFSLASLPTLVLLCQITLNHLSGLVLS